MSSLETRKNLNAIQKLPAIKLGLESSALPMPSAKTSFDPGDIGKPSGSISAWRA